ncbi:hypothetical protein RJ639_002943 [Escallonia herrerae]|uniref:Uncharacterized protein n=1 Tax=Escallonia herrerae TaxID=1293975 RepID=A0AA88W5S6_9ASTE|nr:hypothetical protein RJ639_002943 [Escallonia herrerae]
MIWDELADFEQMLTCKCRKCTCDLGSVLEKKREEEKVQQFLMGLDETIYGTVRSNLLAQDPLPNLNRVYSTLIQEERVKTIARGKEERATLNGGAIVLVVMGKQVAEVEDNNNKRWDIVEVVDEVEHHVQMLFRQQEKDLSSQQPTQLIQRAQEHLDLVSLLGAKQASVPLEQNHRLALAIGRLIDDPERYHRLVGRLIYLCFTRPELSYCIHVLSQFMQLPREEHWETALHVVRYLKGNPSQAYGLSIWIAEQHALQGVSYLRGRSCARGHVGLAVLVAIACLRTISRMAREKRVRASSSKSRAAPEPAPVEVDRNRYRNREALDHFSSQNSSPLAPAIPYGLLLTRIFTAFDIPLPCEYIEVTRHNVLDCSTLRRKGLLDNRSHFLPEPDMDDAMDDDEEEDEDDDGGGNDDAPDARGDADDGIDRDPPPLIILSTHEAGTSFGPSASGYEVILARLDMMQ